MLPLDGDLRVIDLRVDSPTYKDEGSFLVRNDRACPVLVRFAPSGYVAAPYVDDDLDPDASCLESVLVGAHESVLVGIRFCFDPIPLGSEERGVYVPHSGVIEVRFKMLVYDCKVPYPVGREPLETLGFAYMVMPPTDRSYSSDVTLCRTLESRSRLAPPPPPPPPPPPISNWNPSSKPAPQRQRQRQQQQQQQQQPPPRMTRSNWKRLRLA